MNIEMLYVYSAARDDGLNFAVGATFTDGPVNGAYALFAGKNACMVFVEAMRETYGVRVEILPTVSGGPNMIELANGSFHPVTTD